MRPIKNGRENSRPFQLSMVFCALHVAEDGYDDEADENPSKDCAPVGLFLLQLVDFTDLTRIIFSHDLSFLLRLELTV